MDEDCTLYTRTLNGKWRMGVVVVDDATVLSLVHDEWVTASYKVTVPGYEMYRLVYRHERIPVVYHEGIEAPPLVCFHYEQGDCRAFYVWEPLSGRLYHPGSDHYRVGL